MKLEGKKINFLGDSITQGIGVEESCNFYVNRIAERYGAVCRNYGISGTRIARQKTPSEDPSHDLYFGSRVEGMDPDADIIFVFGGTNDFGHGDAPLGTMDDRTLDTFYGGLHLLYQQLMTKYPGKVIVIATPLHRTNEDNVRGDGNKAEDVAPLKTYAEIIREVAEYYSLPVLDLFRVSGLQPKVQAHLEMFVPDGLHPNDAGHAILADRIGAFLESI